MKLTLRWCRWTYPKKLILEVTKLREMRSNSLRITMKNWKNYSDFLRRNICLNVQLLRLANLRLKDPVKVIVSVQCISNVDWGRDMQFCIWASSWSSGVLDFTTSTVVNSSEIESYDLNLKSSRTGEREDKSLRRQETLIKFHFETLVSTASMINSSKEWDVRSIQDPLKPSTCLKDLL